MPSTRPHPLNPRLPGVPAPPQKSVAPSEGPPAPAAQARLDPSPATPSAEASARAGGFHESSYELQHGLLVNESDWPDDVTVPGALGER